MTVNEAIARADGLRLNTLEDQQKAEWLEQLDWQLWEMIGKDVGDCQAAPPDDRSAAFHMWPEKDPTLLLSGPYEEVYPLYLMCKIDYYNQEMDLYANDMAQYNQAMSEAKAWWRRNHMPQQKGHWEVGLP